jgi:hypothetical protein
MEPAIGNNLSEEFDDKLTMTSSEEEEITEDEGESSTYPYRTLKPKPKAMQ